MVHIRRTPRKSTGDRLTVGQLEPRGTTHQPEETAKPQQEKESAEPQQKEELTEPQHEENVIHSQGDSNDPSEYTPLSDHDDSDSEPEPVRASSEFRSYGE
jgi:hypothetical protein